MNLSEKIKIKIEGKDWKFSEIANVKATTEILANEIMADMTALERLEILQEVTITEEWVGTSFNTMFTAITLQEIEGEVAQIISLMLSSATINFGGNKNDISEGSMGGKPHKERTADEKKDSEE
tara:strand:+ start:212 stop:583 length:372 start_codon:yes stop_codon:yes gene_type:complete